MNEKEIINTLKVLFKKCFYETPLSIKRITGGVSGRIIFKIQSRNYICIGVHNARLEENRAFIQFSKAFLGKGLRVPQIYCVSDNNEYYLEEFLGDSSLYELTSRNTISKRDKLKLYKRALSDLAEFQIKGKGAVDYKYCYETKEFNKKQIYFDLDKFRSYFLKKLTCLNYSDAKFSSIKKALLNELSKERNSYFLYRDFQPRNIMYSNGELSYIDYQSGRRGPLQYDLASFLYSGSIDITESSRKALMNHYIKEISMQIKISPDKFKKSFYYFALARLVQITGSYGFIYEENKDAKIIKKIKKAGVNLRSIIKNLGDNNLAEFANDVSGNIIRISKNL